jgi:hypothetical protein
MNTKEQEMQFEFMSNETKVKYICDTLISLTRNSRIKWSCKDKDGSFKCKINPHLDMLIFGSQGIYTVRLYDRENSNEFIYKSVKFEPLYTFLCKLHSPLDYLCFSIYHKTMEI